MRQRPRSRSCTRAFSAASSARSAAIAPARRPRDHSMEPASTPPPGATPQPVAEPLTRAAIFLVLTVHQGAAHLQAVREFCPELGDRLFGAPKPLELHPFREVRAGARHAVATPGDLLFHIRAERFDLCFELAGQIMSRLGPAVSA